MKYVIVSEYQDKLVDGIPCPFLKGNLCSLYNDRPDDCRDFPHLHKAGFRQRISSTFEIAPECPIIFNVLEELKSELLVEYRKIAVDNVSVSQR